MNKQERVGRQNFRVRRDNTCQYTQAGENLPCLRHFKISVTRLQKYTENKTRWSKMQFEREADQMAQKIF